MGVISILVFTALMQVVQSRYYTDQRFVRRFYARDFPRAIRARHYNDYNPFPIKQLDAVGDRRSRDGRYGMQKTHSMDFRPDNLVPAFHQQRFQDNIYEDNINLKRSSDEFSFVTVFDKDVAYVGFALMKQLMASVAPNGQYNGNVPESFTFNLKEKYGGKGINQMIDEMLHVDGHLGHHLVIFADFIDLDDAFLGIAYNVLKKYAKDGTITVDPSEVLKLTKKDGNLNWQLQQLDYMEHIKPLVASLAGANLVPSNGDLEADIKRLGTSDCIQKSLAARAEFKLAQIATTLVFGINNQDKDTFLENGVPDSMTLLPDHYMKEALAGVSDIDISGASKDIGDMPLLQHLNGKNTCVVNAMKLGANLYRKMRS